VVREVDQAFECRAVADPSSVLDQCFWDRSRRPLANALGERADAATLFWLVGTISERLLGAANWDRVTADRVLLVPEELALGQRDELILDVVDGPVRQPFRRRELDQRRDLFDEPVEAERGPEPDVHRLDEVAGDVVLVGGVFSPANIETTR